MLRNKLILLVTTVFLLGLLTSGIALAQAATFWTAPNPAQEVFWHLMAAEFMEEKPEYKISIMPMAEAPSSEATILTAIAGGTVPAASENIFIGFGAELVASEALVALDTMPGWEELISARQMEEALQSWAFPDGHFYILPIYSNPILYGWRIDLLQELGIGEIPRTYEEVIAAGRIAQENGLFLMVRPALAKLDWWERWFDFFTLYNAISGQQPFIVGDEVVADEEAVLEVFRFYEQLGAEGLILTQDVQDAFPMGMSLWSELGPWTFPSWREQYPEMVYGETFELALPPVPAHLVEEADNNTFADAKGLVLYAQASLGELETVWQFIKWVYSKPENDLVWLNQTSLPPIRDDLAVNPAFVDYFAAAPELMPYAEYMALAVPPFANDEFADIQTVLGEEGLLPVVRGRKTPEQAWEDAKRAITEILVR